jgi:hypothetical protein
MFDEKKDKVDAERQSTKDKLRRGSRGRLSREELELLEKPPDPDRISNGLQHRKVVRMLGIVVIHTNTQCINNNTSNASNHNNNNSA